MWVLQDMVEADSSQLFEVCEVDSVRRTLRQLVQGEPRIVQVDLSTNEAIHIGIGGPWSFVQHVTLEPWLAELAMTKRAFDPKPESVWYSYCGELSEVPAKYLLPCAEAIEVVAAFFEQQAIPKEWQWEAI